MSKLSDIFKTKAAKGAVAGAVGIGVAAAVLPVLTVSLPVLAIGAGVGAYIAHKNQ